MAMIGVVGEDEPKMIRKSLQCLSNIYSVT